MIHVTLLQTVYFIVSCSLWECSACSLIHCGIDYYYYRHIIFLVCNVEVIYVQENCKRDDKQMGICVAVYLLSSKVITVAHVEHTLAMLLRHQ